MSGERPKLALTLVPFESTLNYLKVYVSDRNTMPIIIISIAPVDCFLRGFWRSFPSINRLLMTCITYSKKRQELKRSADRSVQYISVVSSSPQLTSSSSSSTPATSSSSVSSSSPKETKKLKQTQMAPNDTRDTAIQPSAPTPGVVLFNSEEQSDIVFLVGEEPDQVWRFPAHSFIVENASPMFKAIVDSGRNLEKPFNKRIDWCKPEIFHVILRHIYTNEITLTTVSNALVMFTSANQLLLNDLSRICLTFLYDNCDDHNVLQMISHFSEFSYLRLSSTQENYVDVDNDGPNARPLARQYSNCDNILNELITRCYHVIDSQAVKILSSKAFETMSLDMIVKILSRDTLKLESELNVFDCIVRWSCQECNKQCRALTSANKRELLGKALYCPRYLTMTVDQFMRGPLASDILSDEEKFALLARLNGDNQLSLPTHLCGRKLDVERKFVERQSIVNGMAGAPPSTSAAAAVGDAGAGIVVKKKSASKKLLNGLGDLVICVIRILD